MTTPFLSLGFSPGVSLCFFALALLSSLFLSLQSVLPLSLLLDSLSLLRFILSVFTFITVVQDGDRRQPQISRSVCNGIHVYMYVL